jgi:hypothetical protein
VTNDQVITTTYFGWAALAIMCIVILRFVWGWWGIFMTLYQSSYSSVGDDQGIAFSTVESRSAYIPQVTSQLFAYPLVACKTDDVDPELFDWVDTDRSFQFYDLTKDAEKLLSELNLEEVPGFSLVKHFPPPEK